MLVFTRKVRQSFQIGKKINIKLIRIKGSQACVEINAPYAYQIYHKREKLFDSFPHKKSSLEN